MRGLRSLKQLAKLHVSMRSSDRIASVNSMRKSIGMPSISRMVSNSMRYPKTKYLNLK